MITLRKPTLSLANFTKKISHSLLVRDTKKNHIQSVSQDDTDVGFLTLAPLLEVCMPGFWKRTKKSPTKFEAISKSEDIADYFHACGIDYKGQAQTAVIEKGVEVGAGFSMDIQGLAGPLSLGFGVSTTITTLKSRFIVSQRGPTMLTNSKDSGEVHTFCAPILLNCLIGWRFKAAVEGEFWTGVGAEAEIGLQGSSDQRGLTKYSGAGVWTKESDPAPALEWAALGASAGVFAGLKADVRGEFEHYFGVDPIPYRFAIDETKDGQHYKATVTALLKTAEKEGAICLMVVDHVNQVRQLIEQSFTSSTGTHKKDVHVYSTGTRKGHDVGLSFVGTSAAKALQTLKDINYTPLAGLEPEALRKKGLPTVGALKRRHADLENYLNEVIEKKSNPDPHCHLHIISTGIGGKLTVGGEATAGVETPIAKGGVSIGLDLGSVSALAQACWARYQTPLGPTDRASAAPVIYTQDTGYKYATFNIDLLKARGGIEAYVAQQGLIPEKFAEISASLAGWEYNLMSYQSAIVYWEPPQRDALTQSVVPLSGSGLVFGQSCSAGNLMQAINALKSGTNPWIERLAKRLGLANSNCLVRFLQSADVRDMVESFTTRSQDLEHIKTADPGKRWWQAWKHKEEPWEARALLVESAFVLPTSTLVRAKQTTVNSTAVTKLVSSYRNDLVKNHIESPDRESRLQCIRLRYRIADYTANANGIQLGFRVAGKGLSASLMTINNLGREGVVDLATVWVDSVGQKLQLGAQGIFGGNGLEQNAPKAVPSPILFGLIADG